MSLVGLQNVSLGFGGESLLENIELQIEPGERVCLVGRNGTGKSTLLRLIKGEIEPDRGEITWQRGLKISDLPQRVPQNLSGAALTIVEGGLSDRSMFLGKDPVSTVASRLNIDLNGEFSTLSGGLKRRVLLGRALVSEPDLLLLDEPTNHLDISSIVWMEEFLERSKSTLLFVTHDRMFLEKLATRVVEIDRGRLLSWPGNYRQYCERKQVALEGEMRAQKAIDKKLSEEEAWLRKGIKARRTRNEGRVRALLKLREAVRARRGATGEVRMAINQAKKSGKIVLKAENLSFSYGDKRIVDDFSTLILRGDKVGIIGQNGCGKTTLLSLLLGTLEPQKGVVEQGVGLEVVYLDQMRDLLDDQKTVLENLSDGNDWVTYGGQKKHVIGYLRDFLFTSERAHTPVWVLSGGERNRLLLAKLFTKPSNVLVLDEPTNDLDADTLEVLEECLAEYSGTVLLVSHDRAFLNNVVTSTIAFEASGEIVECAGGYDDYLSQTSRCDPRDDLPVSPRKKKREKKESVRRLTYKEKIELGQLPSQIETLESELGDLETAMGSPEFYNRHGDDISSAVARMNELQETIAALYARWEILEEIAEISGQKS